ncbi:hypothetical protein BH10BAC1_BH10BAC1_20010 [soil metagenome]
MKQKVISFLILFSSICLFENCSHSSDNSISSEEKLLIQQIHDSLTLSGKHGYFVIPFIVGRIKTMPIVGSFPFKINVVEINPEFLKKSIKFKIIDSLNYEVAYPISEKEETKLRAMYDKPAENKEMKIIVSPTNSQFQLAHSKYEQLKMIDYTFKVYSY